MISRQVTHGICMSGGSANRGGPRTTLFPSAEIGSEVWGDRGPTFWENWGAAEKECSIVPAWEGC